MAQSYNEDGKNTDDESHRDQSLAYPVAARLKIVHYRTERLCISCGMFDRLTNGLRWRNGWHQEARWDRLGVLKAARE